MTIRTRFARFALWVVTAACGFVGAVLVFVSVVGGIVDRAPGAAAFGIALGLVPSWVAWRCWRRLKRTADAQQVQAGSPAAGDGWPAPAGAAPRRGDAEASSSAATVQSTIEAPSDLQLPPVSQALHPWPGTKSAPAATVETAPSPATGRPRVATTPRPTAPVPPAPEPLTPTSVRLQPPRSRSGANRGQVQFAYAHEGGPHELDGPYSVIDFETTGLSPQRGDRVIEVAIQRIDGEGRVEDEFATLVNPEGRDVGPTFIHHITNERVKNAPTFSEVQDEILQRLAGTIVVAHNAEFEERFLRSELQRTGAAPVTLPALDSLWLSRETLDVPNYKLGTLAQELGVELPDAHSALGDVRALGQVLPLVLHEHGQPLTYASSHLSWEATGTSPRLMTRAPSLRQGDIGWMGNLVNRLPMSGREPHGDLEFRYFDAIGAALADGRITGAEAKQLARIAGDGGLGARQVTTLNTHFLEGLRDAALEDGILTRTEFRDLTRAAEALSMQGFFADLAARVDMTSQLAPAETKAPGRRCGHCRQPGHDRRRCPALT